MSSPRDSIVRSAAESVDSVPLSPETREPMLPDQAELGSSGLPWFEEQSYNLRLADIPLIKEKGGMLDKFEIVLPCPDERAHRPPPGFHSLNQLEMGIRFSIPRFITTLLQYLQVSPSQLAPNSYIFLMSLAVLISYFDIPLTPYILIQLIQVKRLGPRKFYLSHKGDLGFIGENPSSHKGWMSRFFYVRRIGRKRNPWRCDMTWRDNVYTLSPSTSDRAPDLTTFLTTMSDMCYNSPELVKEDLLCHFGFNRKGVPLVGDLGIAASSLRRVILTESDNYLTYLFFAADRMVKVLGIDLTLYLCAMTSIRSITSTRGCNQIE
ncbi:hypothetical protein F511_22110 [Dorcoceras hygrometricum]|uniref:Uncharacterized protein n=1 Tax=Dorcoceras hygrometricum TaxID=472368 RepID=A0A2Z7BC82_9LAMI|nr:hypothetical protein F511_22110 [Dorcoceras hygrometricum]